MELIKQTEQYKIVDTSNEWTVTGTVYNNVNGSISMTCSVASEEGSIGNINYNKPAEGNITVSYDVAEANRDKFATYVDTLIDGILNQFVSKL